MRRHGLRVFQGAPGFEISGDARGAEGVAADLDPHSQLSRPPLDHAPGVARFIGLAVSAPVRPTTERNRGALPASRRPAASI